LNLYFVSTPSYTLFAETFSNVIVKAVADRMRDNEMSLRRRWILTSWITGPKPAAEPKGGRPMTLGQGI